MIEVSPSKQAGEGPKRGHFVSGAKSSSGSAPDWRPRRFESLLERFSHPVPPRELEGDADRAVDLPAVQVARAGPPGLPELRYLQGSLLRDRGPYRAPGLSLLSQ